MDLDNELMNLDSMHRVLWASIIIGGGGTRIHNLRSTKLYNNKVTLGTRNDSSIRKINNFLLIAILIGNMNNYFKC